MKSKQVVLHQPNIQLFKTNKSNKDDSTSAKYCLPCYGDNHKQMSTGWGYQKVLVQKSRTLQYLMSISDVC